MKPNYPMLANKDLNLSLDVSFRTQTGFNDNLVHRALESSDPSHSIGSDRFTPLTVSIGQIPSPSPTRIGEPFDDGFPCWTLSNLHMNHNLGSLKPIRSPPKNFTAIKFFKDCNNNTTALIKKSVKNSKIFIQPSIDTSNDSIDSSSNESNQKSSFDARYLNSQKALQSNQELDNLKSTLEPKLTLDTPKTNLNSLASKLTPTFTPDLLSSSLTISNLTSPSKSSQPNQTSHHQPRVSSASKEEWLQHLKNLFHQATSTPNSITDEPLKAYNYPKLGDTFESLDDFKELSLLASWTAGHDMHVRNHSKSQTSERCVFTCRYDRCPPRGVSCPFRFVIIKDDCLISPGNKVWRIVDATLDHRNHIVKAGEYDPSGKRTYRNRATLKDSIEASPTHQIFAARRVSDTKNNDNDDQNEDEKEKSSESNNIDQVDDSKEQIDDLNETSKTNQLDDSMEFEINSSKVEENDDNDQVKKNENFQKQSTALNDTLQKPQEQLASTITSNPARLDKSSRPRRSLAKYENAQNVTKRSRKSLNQTSLSSSNLQLHQQQLSLKRKSSSLFEVGLANRKNDQETKSNNNASQNNIDDHFNSNKKFKS
ncbi:hypothetical protein O181_029171 [Austropuccinia psidii MF-1]|uniref:Uncharacterized protein n=1 Tax=Austropuccinia psidii MF-1 TaxID=1389203 RepID=A0A9Q3CVY7_9BASI|nr:hypothetical protein [Austropuccinia psidii MF-1]